MKALSAPLLSPDGKTALFTVTEATADGGRAHLWLAPVDGSGKARQITFGLPADKRGEYGAALLASANARRCSVSAPGTANAAPSG